MSNLRDGKIATGQFCRVFSASDRVAGPGRHGLLLVRDRTVWGFDLALMVRSGWQSEWNDWKLQKAVLIALKADCHSLIGTGLMRHVTGSQARSHVYFHTRSVLPMTSSSNRASSSREVESVVLSPQEDGMAITRASSILEARIVLTSFGDLVWFGRRRLAREGVGNV